VTNAATRPRVLLLPGNMCDQRLWHGDDFIIPKTIQNRGLELSYIDFEGDNSIAQMAERALASCAGPLIPIGFSMGGIVAVEMIRIASGRIVSLGLIDTTASPDTRGAQRARHQSEVLAGHLERVVIEELKPNYLAACHRSDDAMLGLLRDMAMGLGSDVFISQNEALRTRPDLTSVLATIDVPTLVACGGEDGLCLPASHQALANQIRQATFLSVPHAGHLLPLEQPAVLAHLISNLLSLTTG
jgi:pimeloyl-ACP methyl ester carboxylesterase